MAEYTYKDVIVDPEDPRVEIGKEYYSAIVPNAVLDFANHNEELANLIEVDRSLSSPFHIKSDCCDCWTCLLVRKKEPEKKWEPFDLSKEEDREKLKGAWVRIKDILTIEYQIVGLNAKFVFLGNNANLETQDLFIGYEFIDGTPCGKLVEQMAGK